MIAVTSARRLEEDAAGDLSRDARVVAIRWDLVEWGVVLDIDTPVSEAARALMKRAWLVFIGISDMTIPMRSTRLPNGIWLTSGVSIKAAEEGFTVYTCEALFPTFVGNAMSPDKSSGELSIRAQGLVGVVSFAAAEPSEYGLSYEDRNKLATDADMLRAIDGA